MTFWEVLLPQSKLLLATMLIKEMRYLLSYLSLQWSREGFISSLSVTVCIWQSQYENIISPSSHASIIQNNMYKTDVLTATRNIYPNWYAFRLAPLCATMTEGNAVVVPWSVPTSKAASGKRTGLSFKTTGWLRRLSPSDWSILMPGSGNWTSAPSIVPYFPNGPMFALNISGPSNVVTDLFGLLIFTKAQLIYISLSHLAVCNRMGIPQTLPIEPSPCKQNTPRGRRVHRYFDFIHV